MLAKNECQENISIKREKLNDLYTWNVIFVTLTFLFLFNNAIISFNIMYRRFKLLFQLNQSEINVKF